MSESLVNSEATIPNTVSDETPSTGSTESAPGTQNNRLLRFVKPAEAAV
jgi:hypothetical protein